MLSHARLSILSNVVRNYSATTAAESTAAESATTAVDQQLELLLLLFQLLQLSQR